MAAIVKERTSDDFPPKPKKIILMKKVAHCIKQQTNRQTDSQSILCQQSQVFGQYSDLSCLPFALVVRVVTDPEIYGTQIIPLPVAPILLSVVPGGAGRASKRPGELP